MDREPLAEFKIDLSLRERLIALRGGPSAHERKNSKVIEMLLDCYEGRHHHKEARA
jgi:hypothetical protein